jgi:tRNA pseudouridine13 synthase
MNPETVPEALVDSAPRAWGAPVGRAVIRHQKEDFLVEEQLGFEPSGSGEHEFLWLEKRGRNTADIAQNLASLAGVPSRDVGYSGLKDRNAVTRQWFSVGLAGRASPDWSEIEAQGDVSILNVTRHSKKLRRGSHQGNRFEIVLRELKAPAAELELRLKKIGEAGVPNIFGEQRFGRGGSTLSGARRWVEQGGKVPRSRRSLFLSALRSQLFNESLAQRLVEGSWCEIQAGDVCMLRGSRSFFVCDELDADIVQRSALADISPGLPLWGKIGNNDAWNRAIEASGIRTRHEAICGFLEQQGLDMSWRSTRLMPHDFSWQFCDDDTLQLNFSLSAGSYATALLAELVQYSDGSVKSGIGSE